MSTLQAVAPTTQLDAKTTQKALQAQPVTATAQYAFTVTVFEQFGRAYISWSLNPNYAIGAQDTVQLREGSIFYKNFPVNGISGTYDTGHVWGSGLNGSYWAWDYPAKAWRQLVLTPNTVE